MVCIVQRISFIYSKDRFIKEAYCKNGADIIVNIYSLEECQFNQSCRNSLELEGKKANVDIVIMINIHKRKVRA